MAVVRKPRQGRDRAVEPLAPEAVEAIRSELLGAGDRRSASLAVLMAYAGLRPGEALGLAVRHVRTVIATAGTLGTEFVFCVHQTQNTSPLAPSDHAAWTSGRAGPTTVATRATPYADPT